MIPESNFKHMKHLLFLFSAFFLVSSSFAQLNPDADRIIANPLNLSYRFYTDGISHRTAADPVIEYYNGKYYLFGSHSDGYFSSPDLKTWTYLKSSNLPLAREWAPAVMIYEDAIYYMAFNNKEIYKSTNPDADEWVNINAQCNMAVGDPSFFVDDNGRVYLIWGCSAGSPIQGVELDPKNGFKVKGNAVDLLPHNVKKHGWEVPGDNNERTDKDTWNEGPCLIKVDELYYLQYATPGTEFTSYSTGVYVSENPLGPYTCSVSNPFATKPTGFIPGAGHGHTFKDKYGNYWFVGSMIVSVREHFERRLGIFPVYFDSTDGYMRAHTVFSEFPFVLPEEKVDFRMVDVSAGMNLLSYNKAVSASSFKDGFEPEKATDEFIKTWWAASSGEVNEWFQMDLGSVMTIAAIQMNFADEAFETYRNDQVPIYKYIVETSIDNINWTTTINRSNNINDYVHELIVLEESVEARYVRVTNKAKLPAGCFSLYDLRIFGDAKDEIPDKVSGFTCVRQEDSRRIRFSWDQHTDEGTRYVIRWGTDLERVDNAAIVSGNNADIGLFNVDHGYYFTIEAFNESGIGKKSEAVFVAASDAIPNILPFDQTDKAIATNASVEGLDITPLIDNEAATVLSTTFQQDMYMEVNLSANAKIISYSLTAGAEIITNPKSWELQAFYNNRWRKIDGQKNISFRPYETQTFNITYSSYAKIPNSDAYRLVIKENHGGVNVNIAEWQLSGSLSAFESCITSNGGVITDQYNLTGHEGVQYLIDNKADTKYCAVDRGEEFWMQYFSIAKANVKKYSLTSANDAPGRDPVDWRLEASNDGEKWEVLDSRSNQEFPSRFTTLEYTVTGENKNEYYTYFRLNINKIGTGRTFQLAEWQLMGEEMNTSLSEVTDSDFAVYTEERNLIIKSQAGYAFDYEILSITGQSLSKGRLEAQSFLSKKLVPGTYVIKMRSSESEMLTKTLIN